MNIPKFLVIDLETQSKEMFNRKGHFRNNSIVAIGLKSSSGEEKIDYIYPNKLKNLEIDEDILIGHNLKFDLLHLWSISGIQKFLKNKGKVYDTMLAEYFMSGQTHKFPGLRELAVKYGRPERSKYMEEYWDKGIDTSKIPVNIVLQDLKEDVLDTEAVYLGQQALLTEQQKKLLEIQNDLLLGLTEMEFNGIYCNRIILEQNQLELEAQLERNVNELEELIKPYWKLEC